MKAITERISININGSVSGTERNLYINEVVDAFTGDDVDSTLDNASVDDVG